MVDAVCRLVSINKWVKSSTGSDLCFSKGEIDEWILEYTKDFKRSIGGIWD